ncbi:MAG TPA: hypothetical protein VKK79_24275 [Candidatus Lokiarchaeia archaeon]|nr:hypothetical protein [Candidatus Lokiarchaeia archaeon]
MPNIRLVIFDLGDTIWSTGPDDRVINLEEHPVESMLDPDTMVQGEGNARQLFPGVRELFDALIARGIFISIASINDPWAYKWLGEGYFNLNIANLHFPVTEAGDPDTDVKGYWVERIIGLFNQYVTPDHPISNEQVVFVDDLIRSHRAASKIAPGVHCIFPAPNLEGGMLSLLEFLDEIEEER